jgi:hypothetical protein
MSVPCARAEAYETNNSAAESKHRDASPKERRPTAEEAHISWLLKSETLKAEGSLLTVS